MDKQRELRQVDGASPEDETPDRRVPDAGHAELVADVIREIGLLDRRRSIWSSGASGSFSQALVDEGYASALGVARNLAEEYHLPLVDLAVAGVDAMAAKVIALPVLERVCAIPFAGDGKTLKVAITNPQDVRGLDEIKLATRFNVVFYVAARNDVLTELRRLGRAAEAMNATILDDVVASTRTTRTTSRPTTASPMRRSSGSSTR